MSIIHLKQLRDSLEKTRWKITAELEGNDYDISAVWEIARPDSTNVLHIAFSGLDDLITLPIEKSYGCKIVENKKIKLYFAPISKSWPKLLKAFIKQLNENYK